VSEGAAANVQRMLTKGQSLGFRGDFVNLSTVLIELNLV
jgi:hypothetical protein